MIENWLNQNAPGYISLTQEAKDAIKNFSVLWSLFEAQVLDTWASAKLINEKSTLWNDHGRLKAEEFEQFKDYFVQRYIENDETNNRFDHLDFKDNDNKNLVKSVLKGEENNIASVVEAMLIIVYRYRNNFFHGNKWAYDFNDQLSNFNTANKLLMKVIEINKYDISP